MSLPTLGEFIGSRMAGSTRFPSNLYVKQFGMVSLYVRLGPRYLADVNTWYQMLDIANVTARRPGKGAFNFLFLWLRARYPRLGIFVENVQTDRFALSLVNRFGFSKDETNMHCYYFITTETLVVPRPRMSLVEKAHAHG
jgi:hypothetical protein